MPDYLDVFVAFGRHLASTGGGSTAEWDDAAASDAQSTWPFRNIAVPIRSPKPDLVDRLRSFYGENRKWTVWDTFASEFGPELRCEYEGFVMLRPPSDGDHAGSSKGLVIREVTDTQQIHLFERVRLDCYPSSPMYQAPDDQLLDDRVLIGGFRAWIGYDSDTPVATASIFATERVAWLKFIATLPSHRRRGIASAMSQYVLASAPEVPAVIDATAAVRPMYERLGFETVASLRCWSPVT